VTNIKKYRKAPSSQLKLTLGLKEVFAKQKFGRETNFAWQNSEAVVSNPLSPVKFVSHTQVWETCVRRVKFEFHINIDRRE